jgi:hypothetical protein
MGAVGRVIHWAWLVGRTVILVVLFTLFMVNFHEIGHTLVARAVGDPSAHYVLVQATKTSSCLGCNLYDSASLGDVANIVVNFGGVLFTQLLCWTAIVLMAVGNRRIFPSWVLWTVIVITWLGDLVFQLVQGLTAAVPASLPRGPNMSYTDFTAIAWFARHATGISADTWKLILLFGILAYSAVLAAAAVISARRRATTIHSLRTEPLQA